MLSLRQIIAADGQAAVAERLNISRPYVSQLLSKKRPITAAVLRSALDVYGDRLDVVATLRDMRRPRLKHEWGG